MASRSRQETFHFSPSSRAFGIESHEVLFLEAVRDIGEQGYTADEWQRLIGEEHQSNSPRFTHMKEAGLIRANGKRLTSKGCPADVWIIRLPHEPIDPIRGRKPK